MPTAVEYAVIQADDSEIELLGTNEDNRTDGPYSDQGNDLDGFTGIEGFYTNDGLIVDCDVALEAFITFLKSGTATDLFTDDEQQGDNIGVVINGIDYENAVQVDVTAEDFNDDWFEGGECHCDHQDDFVDSFFADLEGGNVPESSEQLSVEGEEAILIPNLVSAEPEMGIIDVGDLPDGIIDVGDLPDGVDPTMIAKLLDSGLTPEEIYDVVLDLLGDDLSIIPHLTDDLSIIPHLTEDDHEVEVIGGWDLDGLDMVL